MIQWVIIALAAGGTALSVAAGGPPKYGMIGIGTSLITGASAELTSSKPARFCLRVAQVIALAAGLVFVFGVV